MRGLVCELWCKVGVRIRSFCRLYVGVSQAGNELVLRKFRTLFPTWSSADHQEMRGTSFFSVISESVPSEFHHFHTPDVFLSAPGGSR